MRWTTRLFCCGMLGVMLALPVTPAVAGFFDDEETRKQVAELRKEIDALAKRLEGTAQNQIDFANQFEILRADVARLTGQVEVLGNSLEAAHKRQQDFYVDLDNRLRKLENATTQSAAVQAAPEGAAPPAQPAEAKPDPQAEMRDYETALGHLRESRFKEAQAGFEAFITRHTRASLLPNAHYWLGSSLFQQKAYPAAATVFGKLATQWPNDAKAPEALLQQANALVGAKDVDGAVKVLEALVEKYPASPAAETARARIKTLAPKKKR
jgi:tol-pal system protein YbgF